MEVYIILFSCFFMVIKCSNFIFIFESGLLNKSLILILSVFYGCFLKANCRYQNQHVSLSETATSFFCNNVSSAAFKIENTFIRELDSA